MHPAVTYLIYIASALVMLGLFTVIYTGVTRYKEFDLIREGNIAAAMSYGGALVGFRSRSVPASPSMPASPCSWSGAWPRWSQIVVLCGACAA